MLSCFITQIIELNYMVMKQNISFRGHRENESITGNVGNFQTLSKYRAKGDKLLAQNFKIRKKS